MEIAPLSAAQRQSFDSDGFLLLHDVLSEADCDQLEAMADAAMDRHAPPAGTGLENHQTQRQLRLTMSDHPEFIPVVGQPHVVSLVAQLLSPNIHLHTAAVLYKNSYIGNDASAEEIANRGGHQAVFEAESAGWHRDAGITEDVGHAGVFRCGIKACYALTDLTSPMAGMTMFAKGSHLLDSPLPVRKNGQPAEHEPVQPAMRRGDVCLFENRVFHTGSVNLSDAMSKCVMIGYSYRWMGGHRSNMELVWPPYPMLSSLDPVTQQLLGGHGEAQPDLVSLVRGATEGGRLTAASAQTESAGFVWTTEVDPDESSSSSSSSARL
jgi:ectoine hydroxylase-related dioxygenase (phytanoyl-CoA dioxygenase family)